VSVKKKRRGPKTDSCGIQESITNGDERIPKTGT
jgi:hypothetical protein